MSAFAATANNGRVRIDEIVHADAPRQDRGDDAIVIPVTVKGCRDMHLIGTFPTVAAAKAWIDQHLTVAP